MTPLGIGRVEKRKGRLPAIPSGGGQKTLEIGGEREVHVQQIKGRT